jgi:hypothetical protein
MDKSEHTFLMLDILVRKVGERWSTVSSEKCVRYDVNVFATTLMVCDRFGGGGGGCESRYQVPGTCTVNQQKMRRTNGGVLEYCITAVLYSRNTGI